MHLSDANLIDFFFFGKLAFSKLYSGFLLRIPGEIPVLASKNLLSLLNGKMLNQFALLLFNATSTFVKQGKLYSILLFEAENNFI